jgi:hypothetical protein
MGDYIDLAVAMGKPFDSNKTRYCVECYHYRRKMNDNSEECCKFGEKWKIASMCFLDKVDGEAEERILNKGW